MAVWLTKLDLDCRTCSIAQKVERGCIKDSPIPGAWKIDEWEFSRCPRAIVTEKSFEYLNAYFFFEKGYLPNPGGWMDQSVKFIEAMRVIAREIIRIGQTSADK